VAASASSTDHHILSFQRPDDTGAPSPGGRHGRAAPSTDGALAGYLMSSSWICGFRRRSLASCTALFTRKTLNLLPAAATAAGSWTPLIAWMVSVAAQARPLVPVGGPVVPAGRSERATSYQATSRGLVGSLKSITSTPPDTTR
jgi:hypothetical protein